MDALPVDLYPTYAVIEATHPFVVVLIYLLFVGIVILPISLAIGVLKVSHSFPAAGITALVTAVVLAIPLAILGLTMRTTSTTIYYAADGTCLMASMWADDCVSRLESSNAEVVMVDDVAFEVPVKTELQKVNLH